MTIQEINESLAKQQKIHKAALDIIKILDAIEEDDTDGDAREEVLRLVNE